MMLLMAGGVVLFISVLFQPSRQIMLLALGLALVWFAQLLEQIAGK